MITIAQATATIKKVSAKTQGSEKINQTLEYAQEVALEMIDKYDLQRDIVIVANRGVKQAGVAVTPHDINQPVQIGLSKHFILGTDSDFIDNTIRHELAHVIAGHKAGHGARWKRIAREIGAKPERCHTVTLDVAKKWVATCPSCDHKHYYARKPKRSYSCGNCSGGRYNPKYHMEIVENKR